MDMKRFIRVGLVTGAGVGLAAVVVLSSGFTPHKVVSSTLPTAAQLNKLGSSIGDIVTPSGVYIREENPPTFPVSEIAYNKTDALHPNIKEIVLSYGTFVLTDQAGEKAFQKEWAQAHVSAASNTSSVSKTSTSGQ